MNSELSLKTKSIIPKWLIITIAIVAFIGFIDATYLTAKHYTGGSINCSITHGCDVVTTSEYSEIFGIPVALGGALYYLTVLLLTIYYLDSKNKKVLFFAAQITVFGLLASAWLVYLQAAVIHAWCQYCLLSAITSTLLFILGMIIIFKEKQGRHERQEGQEDIEE